jgi:hypothetical protein
LGYRDGSYARFTTQAAVETFGMNSRRGRTCQKGKAVNSKKPLPVPLSKLVAHAMQLCSWLPTNLRCRFRPKFLVTGSVLVIGYWFPCAPAENQSKNKEKRPLHAARIDETHD